MSTIEYLLLLLEQTFASIFHFDFNETAIIYIHAITLSVYCLTRIESGKFEAEKPLANMCNAGIAFTEQKLRSARNPSLSITTVELIHYICYLQAFAKTAVAEVLRKLSHSLCIRPQQLNTASLKLCGRGLFQNCSEIEKPWRRTKEAPTEMRDC